MHVIDAVALTVVTRLLSENLDVGIAGKIEVVTVHVVSRNRVDGVDGAHRGGHALDEAGIGFDAGLVELIHEAGEALELGEDQFVIATSKRNTVSRLRSS